MKNFPVGLGCMAFSGPYGAANDEESLAVIKRAVDRGVTFFDTGDFYGQGHNEMLLGEALKGAKVDLSVKYGGLRGPDGAFIGFDTREIFTRASLAYSLKRLRVESIAVYRPGRLEPKMLDETVGALAKLVKEGYIRAVGLSEVSADTVERAHRIHPVADLQIEYSIASRGPEAKIFPALRRLGVGATLYGIMSRGLLGSGLSNAATDQRSHYPRFAGEAGKKNADIAQTLKAYAHDSGRTIGQLALNWVLAKQPGFMPLIGSRTRKQLDDFLDGLDKPLSAKEVADIEALAPDGAFEGARYPEQHMALLDSER
jgi:aryl-alcohol dehydrogenase-like predicted oxidoreductase